MRLNTMLCLTFAALLGLSTVGVGCGTSKDGGSETAKAGKKGGEEGSKKGGKKGGKKGSKKGGDDDQPVFEAMEDKTPKEVMKDGAVKVTLPSPGAMFMALKVLGKPKWDGVVKPIQDVKFDSENRNALIAGFLIADFFVHVQARDEGEAMKVIEKLEASADALKLKLPEDQVKDMKDKVKGKKWKEVPSTIDALNSELQLQLLEERKRTDLAQLIGLGAYVEGAWIGTAIVSKDYSKKTVVILQQEELINEIKKSQGLIKSDTYSDAVFEKMSEVKKLMKPDKGEVISEDNVKEMHSIISGIRSKVLG